MNEPVSPKVFLARKESIPRMERVVCAVAEAARRRGGAVWRSLPFALLAGCLRCGARVSGEELVQLAGFPGPQESDRLRRLRRGRCVRDDCSCDEYQLIFRSHPNIDWVKLLSSVEEGMGAADDDDPQAAIEQRREDFERWKRRIRLALLVAAVVALLIARQWYAGGRIPFVREPRNFRVEPAPHQKIPK